MPSRSQGGARGNICTGPCSTRVSRRARIRTENAPERTRSDGGRPRAWIRAGRPNAWALLGAGADNRARDPVCPRRRGAPSRACPGALRCARRGRQHPRQRRSGRPTGSSGQRIGWRSWCGCELSAQRRWGEHVAVLGQAGLRIRVQCGVVDIVLSARKCVLGLYLRAWDGRKGSFMSSAGISGVYLT
jgi:hypothetical protein